MYVDVYYISTGIYRNKMVSAPLNWCYKQVLGTKWRGQWQHLSQVISSLPPQTILSLPCCVPQLMLFQSQSSLSHTKGLTNQARLTLNSSSRQPAHQAVRFL